MADSTAKSSLTKRVKTTVKPYLPKWFLKLHGKWWLYRWQKENASKSAEEVFTRIYERNEWGGVPGEYFSGPGSIDETVSIYVETIKKFIENKRITQVVDLGCGDFRIGSQLLFPGMKYIGVDIVQPLIEHNQMLFGNTDVTFQHLNIVNDELPHGGLCLIRQVLEHLSNKEIIQILQKIKKYKYAIVTEQYLPANMQVTPNKEKPHGPDIRLGYGSAVYLDKPPFNVKNLEILSEVTLQNYAIYKGERLITFLIRSESGKI